MAVGPLMVGSPDCCAMKFWLAQELNVARTVTVKFLVAAAPMLLVALAVPEKVPNCVGVPEITPVDERVSPAGREPEPEVRLNVEAGEPNTAKA